MKPIKFLKSLNDSLKMILLIFLVAYLAVSCFVIYDYLNKHYGLSGKIFCTFGVKDRLKEKVVRVVGGYSEGTGFFVTSNQILTNFHVIADEPSPKIIMPDGSFITPIKIAGDKNADLALITLDKNFPDLIFSLPDKLRLYEDQQLIATGYALGTNLKGAPTVLAGNYVDLRKSNREKVSHIQTTISLVEGMSGGPLTDQCGDVVGINQAGLAGLSLFIDASEARRLFPAFTDEDITKIDVDPSKSPQDAVTAFYTYLKARKMKDGFDLLSKEYLKNTNFTEWTSRFSDVLDVDIISTEEYKKPRADTVKVKFSTTTWVDGETVVRFYGGTWQTIKEDGVYKMRRSNIGEVTEPSDEWYYGE